MCFEVGTHVFTALFCLIQIIWKSREINDLGLEIHATFRLLHYYDIKRAFR